MANLSNINNKFVLTTDGAVLINQGSVDYGTAKLQVSGNGSTGTITWRNDGGRKTGYLYSDSNGIAIYSTALNNAGIYLADNLRIDFRVNGSEKMRITSGARINMDVMAGQASEGVIRIGRYDVNTTRYNEIQNSVTSTGAGSYMNLSVHSGTENVVTDVMTLLGDGNVGIGVSPITSPNSADKSLSIYSGQDCSIILKDNVETWEIYQNDDLQFSFGTTPNTVMTMQRTTGYVGIGTVSPDAKLHIYGSASLSEMYLGEDAAADKAGILKYTQGDGSGTGVITLSHWGNNSLTEGLAVKYGGNVGIGTTSPDDLLTLSGDTNSYTTVPVVRFDSTSTNSVNVRNWAIGPADTEYGNFHIFKSAARGGDPVDGIGAKTFTINYLGNVGIGTTTPVNFTNQTSLTIDGTSIGRVDCLAGGSGGGGMFASSSQLQVFSNFGVNLQLSSAANIDFVTSSTDRMKITSGGDVLMGGFAANGSVSPTLNGFGFTASGTATAVCNFSDVNEMFVFNQRDGAGTTQIDFRNGNVERGKIQWTTSGTSYNSTSDYRLKENVVEMTGALDRVNQLKPSRFNFIADADKTVDGFLAHEVQEIVPEAITGEKDEIRNDGTPRYQGIDQSKLVPLLVGAIQELKAEIELLKNK